MDINECLQLQREYGFQARQSFFCHDEQTRHSTYFIHKAAKTVVEFCPQVFADRRWNCSSVALTPVITPDLSRSTRERGVVQAMSSAALFAEIARGCSQNKLTNCPCGKWEYRPSHNVYSSSNRARTYRSSLTIDEQFQYEGCSDNMIQAKQLVGHFLGLNAVDPGDGDTYLSRRFRQARRFRRINFNRFANRYQPSINRVKRQDQYRNWRGYTPPQYRKRREENIFTEPHIPLDPQLLKQRRKVMRLVNAHNYMAGIAMMERNVKDVCKCHGTSGSCAAKVCIRLLRRVTEDPISEEIKRLYLHAKLMVKVNEEKLMTNALVNGDFAEEMIEPSKIAFSEDSPDFCLPEPSRGSLGTKGRLCGLEEKDNFHCFNMCCGRGYRNHTYTSTYDCNCRVEDFVIKCGRCPREVSEHICF
ncbi:Protein Wnt-11 [Cichlidogyrus casuarinus]|uniref:Protein Wnt n=1 Tax=Cichlidogyrus casuarinus TaxID=1844966 RepID=A0ABD2QF89_9PLAT